MYTVLLWALTLVFAPVAGMGELYLGAAVVLGAVFLWLAVRLLRAPDPGRHAPVLLLDHLHHPAVRCHGGRAARAGPVLGIGARPVSAPVSCPAPVAVRPQRFRTPGDACVVSESEPNRLSTRRRRVRSPELGAGEVIASMAVTESGPEAATDATTDDAAPAATPRRAGGLGGVPRVTATTRSSAALYIVASLLFGPGRRRRRRAVGRRADRRRVG